MNGLISSMPMKQPMQPGPQQPGRPMQPGPQQPGQPVSPSKRPLQDDYAQFVARGLEMISSQEASQGILQLLKSGRPVESLADTAVMVVRKLDEGARSKGIEVQDTVKVLGTYELITELANVAKAAKIFDLDKDHVELAFSVAVQEYIKQEISAGRVDGNKLKAELDVGAGKLKPEEREAMNESMQRVAMTAERYAGGGE